MVLMQSRFVAPLHPIPSATLYVWGLGRQRPLQNIESDKGELWGWISASHSSVSGGDNPTQLITKPAHSISAQSNSLILKPFQTNSNLCKPFHANINTFKTFQRIQRIRTIQNQFNTNSNQFKPVQTFLEPIQAKLGRNLGVN